MRSTLTRSSSVRVENLRDRSEYRRSEPRVRRMLTVEKSAYVFCSASKGKGWMIGKLGTEVNMAGRHTESLGLGWMGFDMGS